MSNRQTQQDAGTAGAGVFILDDDPQIRQRFVQQIDASDGFFVTAAVASLHDALTRAEAARQAKIALVDLRLPDGNGADFIQTVQGWEQRPICAVISALGDEQSVLAAIRAGARGYLLKDVRNADLAPALRALLRGESPISPAIARHVLRQYQDPAGSGSVESLTRRETDVLGLVAKGYSTREVAESLQLAESTITSHIKSIYRKLDVHSRSQAVHEAAQLGLVRLGR